IKEKGACAIRGRPFRFGGKLLELDFETYLNGARAAGTDDRVGCSDVRCFAGITKGTGHGWVHVAAGAEHAERIGEVRKVEKVEELTAKLKSKSFAELPSLYEGEVPVAIDGTTEEIATHGAKGICSRGNHHGTALGEASEVLQSREQPGSSGQGNTGGIGGCGKVRNGTVLGGGEIRRLAEEVPAVGIFTRSAYVVPVDEAIDRPPRQTCLQGDDGINLPALEELAPSPYPGQFIGKREGETMADVQIAAGIFGAGVEAVLGIQAAIEGCLIDRVRPGITEQEGDAMPRALVVADLQAIVFRFVAVREVVDDIEERESGLIGPCAGDRVELINVEHTVELGAFVTDIADVERAGGRNLLLYIEAPGRNVGSAKVAVDGENVARAGAALRRSACENGSSKTPVQAGIVIGRSHNFSATRGDTCDTRRNDADARGGSVIHAVLSNEDRDVGNFVDQAGARANGGFAFAGGVPDNANARTEIVVIAVVG